MAQALKNPDLLKRLDEMAAEPRGLAGGDRDLMKQETERWGAVIRSAGGKLDKARLGDPGGEPAPDAGSVGGTVAN